MAEQEQQAEGQEPEAKSEPETFEREYVEGLRSEAKGYRLKLRDAEKRVENLETRLTELEDKDKPELERLVAEKQRLEKTLEEREKEIVNSAVNASIKVSAANLNVVDVDAAAALLDKSELDYVDGQVTGVDKALKKLVKDKPWLVKPEEKPTPPSPGAGGPPIDSEPKDIDSAFLGMRQSARKPE